MDKWLKPYSGEDGYVFVSYSHKDSNEVLKVIAHLAKQGIRIWYDEGINPGTEWDENIASHIDGCSGMIAFVSKNYLSSGNCKDELNYARDLDLIYLENVNLPSGMAMRLNRLQSVHKYTYHNKTEFYQKLLQSNIFIDSGYQETVSQCSQESNIISVDRSYMVIPSTITMFQVHATFLGYCIFLTQVFPEPIMDFNFYFRILHINYQIVPDKFNFETDSAEINSIIYRENNEIYNYYVLGYIICYFYLERTGVIQVEDSSFMGLMELVSFSIPVKEIIAYLRKYILVPDFHQLHADEVDMTRYIQQFKKHFGLE